MWEERKEKRHLQSKLVTALSGDESTIPILMHISLFRIFLVPIISYHTNTNDGILYQLLPPPPSCTAMLSLIIAYTSFSMLRDILRRNSRVPMVNCSNGANLYFATSSWSRILLRMTTTNNQLTMNSLPRKVWMITNPYSH